MYPTGHATWGQWPPSSMPPPHPAYYGSHMVPGPPVGSWGPPPFPPHYGPPPPGPHIPPPNIPPPNIPVPSWERSSPPPHKTRRPTVLVSLTSETELQPELWPLWPQPKPKPKPGVESKQFSCDTCDHVFTSKMQLFKHFAEHIKCGYDGCKFEGLLGTITPHVVMQHDTGYSEKIMELESPEEIAKWREERKKNYPSSEAIAKRQAEVDAKRTIFCDACDDFYCRSFIDKEDLEDHCRDHQKCNFKGCVFEGLPTAFSWHLEVQHVKTSYGTKIARVKSPESIKEWREERKRLYPTVERIAKRKAELASNPPPALPDCSQPIAVLTTAGQNQPPRGMPPNQFQRAPFHGYGNYNWNQVPPPGFWPVQINPPPGFQPNPYNQGPVGGDQQINRRRAENNAMTDSLSRDELDSKKKEAKRQKESRDKKSRKHSSRKRFTSPLRVSYPRIRSPLRLRYSRSPSYTSPSSTLHHSPSPPHRRSSRRSRSPSPHSLTSLHRRSSQRSIRSRSPVTHKTHKAVQGRRRDLLDSELPYVSTSSHRHSSRHSRSPSRRRRRSVSLHRHQSPLLLGLGSCSPVSSSSPVISCSPVSSCDSLGRCSPVRRAENRSPTNKSQPQKMGAVSRMVALELLKHTDTTNNDLIRTVKEQVFAELVKEDSFGDSFGLKLKQALGHSSGSDHENLPLDGAGNLQLRRHDHFADDPPESQSNFAHLLSKLSNAVAKEEDKWKAQHRISNREMMPPFEDEAVVQAHREEEMDTHCNDFMTANSHLKQGSLLDTLNSEEKILIAQQLATILAATGQSEVSDDLLEMLVQQVVASRSNASRSLRATHSKPADVAETFVYNRTRSPPAQSSRSDVSDYQKYLPSMANPSSLPSVMADYEENTHFSLRGRRESSVGSVETNTSFPSQHSYSGDYKQHLGNYKDSVLNSYPHRDVLTANNSVQRSDHVSSKHNISSYVGYRNALQYFDGSGHSAPQ